MQQVEIIKDTIGLLPIAYGDIRRFQVPDVERHGGWMARRMAQAYPHLTERQVPGWLRGIVYMNEFLFLYQDHSVCLAQAVRPDPFTPKIVIWERFVWAESQDYIGEAADFYARMKVWALQQDSDTIVVGEQTDVPLEMIKAKLGKLLERKQLYARL
jgi:hypothetical protein